MVSPSTMHSELSEIDCSEKVIAMLSHPRVIPKNVDTVVRERVLTWALDEGYLEVLRCLQSRGFDFSSPRLLLHLAVEKDFGEAVNLLLEVLHAMWTWMVATATHRYISPLALDAPRS